MKLFSARNDTSHGFKEILETKGETKGQVPRPQKVLTLNPLMNTSFGM
jgi:hypothetical protein